VNIPQKIDGDAIVNAGWTYIRFVVDVAREPFLLLDSDLRIICGNDAFYRFFLVTSEDTEKKLVYDLGNGQWNSPQLRKLLEDILPKSTFFKDFEVEHEFPLIGKKIMIVNARIMYGKKDEKPFIIMAMEDVSKQRILEDKLKEYAKQLEMKVLERTNELENRIKELETINTSMINRELRMVDLKKQIEELKLKLVPEKSTT
jgi:nitrogen-specific signal transduction histidine kinase